MSLALIPEFGVDFALKKLVYKYSHQVDKYIANGTNALRPHLDYDSAIDNENTEMPLVVPIWVMWWQGYEEMPAIVKLCFDSLKRNLPSSSSLILLTKENYKTYSQIPNEIVKKVEDGKYSITVFSDLIRNDLLSRYGGFWVDSTVYCANEIPYEFLETHDFWSVKLVPESDDYRSIGRTVSKRMWGGFIQKASPNSRLNCLVFNSLKAYMMKHDVLAEYFIQNFFIRMLYEKDNEIKESIDRIPYSNPHLYSLAKIMNKKFNAEEWNALVCDTSFFKLSWKEKYLPVDSDGDMTFYGYLLKCHKPNME